MIDYKEITKYFKPITTEISILKSVVESSVTTSNTVDPLVVFFQDDDNKSAIVGFLKTDSLEDTIVKFSEVMHLYGAINSSAAIVVMTAKMDHDNTIYETLNLFALTDSKGWVITLPYLVQNKSVVWYDNLSEILDIDDAQYDGPMKEMVSMLYFLTHLDNQAYTAPEILSYLSTTGATVHLCEGHEIGYYDMSNHS